jgi:hypothetical protein
VFVGTKDLRDKGAARVVELSSHCELLKSNMQVLVNYVAQFPNLSMFAKLDVTKVRDEVQLEWRKTGTNQRYTFSQVDELAVSWVGVYAVDEVLRVNALAVLLNRELKLSLSSLKLWKGFLADLPAGELVSLVKRV